MRTDAPLSFRYTQNSEDIVQESLDSVFTFHQEVVKYLSPITTADACPFREALWYMPEAQTITADGIPAVVHPVMAFSDQVLVALMVLSLLVGLDVACRSWKYLTSRAVVDFFYPSDHTNMYEENTPDSRMAGGLPMAAYVAIPLSVLFYLGGVSSQWWVCIAGGIACVMGWVGLYALVNSTFFESGPRERWRHGMRLVMFIMATLLWGICASAVFVLHSTDGMLMEAFLAVGVAKILLLVKAQRTFFPEPAHALHLILYFCTLEFFPLLALYVLITQ